MKFLKYVLGILAFLLICFLAIGMISPSITYESEITVEKSAAEAWAVMNDESKTTEWLQGIKTIEHISGDKGKVGAVTKYIFDDGNGEQELFETMKSITPEEQVKMDFTMEGVMDMDYTMDFMEEDGTTKMKSTTIVKGGSLMMKSLVPMMKGSMIKQEEVNMGNLKKLIDGNTTDYFPVLVEKAEEASE